MKRLLRDKILSLRGMQTPDEIIEKSMRIKEQLFKLPEFVNTNTILFYVSKEDEVKTDFMIKELLKSKKRIMVPVSDKNKKSLILSEIKDFDKELEIGSFNILEPKKEFLRILDPSELDLVIVPGIAFDEWGNRIGYGKGFYDNFLRNLKKEVIKIALAYEIQIVDKIPTTFNDVPVDKIVTEKKVICCKN